MRGRRACADSARSVRRSGTHGATRNDDAHPMSFSAASLRAVLDAHTPAGATGLVVALSGGADSAGLLAAASAMGLGVRGLPLRAGRVDRGGGARRALCRPREGAQAR